MKYFETDLFYLLFVLLFLMYINYVSYLKIIQDWKYTFAKFNSLFLKIKMHIQS